MRKFLIAALLVTAAGPAMARHEKQLGDPNRVICRTVEQVGSRLQSQKTCLTAMQWDQLERDQRTTVEHVQIFSAQGH